MRIICREYSLNSFSQDCRSGKNIWKCLERPCRSLRVLIGTYRKDRRGLGSVVIE